VALVFKIDFSRFRSIRKQYEDGLQRVHLGAVRAAGRQAADFARTNHKHKRRSGLATSKANLFHRVVRTTKRSTMGELANTTVYVRYSEFGNAPGGAAGARIFPTSARALRFRINGVLIFRRSVASHGPLPFMFPAGRLFAQLVAIELDERLSQLGQVWSSARG